MRIVYDVTLHPDFEPSYENQSQAILDNVGAFLDNVTLGLTDPSQRLCVGNFDSIDSVFKGSLIDIMPFQGHEVLCIAPGKEKGTNLHFEYGFRHSFVVSGREGIPFGPFRISTSYTDEPNAEMERYQDQLLLSYADNLRRLASESQ